MPGPPEKTLSSRAIVPTQRWAAEVRKELYDNPQDATNLAAVPIPNKILGLWAKAVRDNLSKVPGKEYVKNGAVELTTIAHYIRARVTDRFNNTSESISEAIEQALGSAPGANPAAICGAGRQKVFDWPGLPPQRLISRRVTTEGDQRQEHRESSRFGVFCACRRGCKLPSCSVVPCATGSISYSRTKRRCASRRSTGRVQSDATRDSDAYARCRLAVAPDTSSWLQTRDGESQPGGCTVPLCTRQRTSAMRMKRTEVETRMKRHANDRSRQMRRHAVESFGTASTRSSSTGCCALD